MGKRSDRQATRATREVVELTSLDHAVLLLIDTNETPYTCTEPRLTRVLDRLVRAHAVQRFVRFGKLTFEITNTGRALLQ